MSLFASLASSAAREMAQVSRPMAAVSAPERRPQAGPLPPKVGEIGYSPKQHAAPARLEEEVADLPERHPADRPHPDEASSSSSADPSHPSSSSTSLPSSSSSDSTHTSTTTASTTRTILSFLKPARMNKPLPTFKGMRAASLVRFFVLVLTLAATITGWAEIVIHLNGVAASFGGSAFSSPSNTTSFAGSDTGNSTDLNNTSNNFPSADSMASTTFIFVHVAFAVAVIFQLLFLERAIFQLRAERYMHLNPAAAAAYNAHPHARAMGLAPWHRPPLPSYAAALGVRGTGDVEDNLIAAPPPPAYGNTRGSTLLLAGFLRDSLRGRVPPPLPDTQSVRGSVGAVSSTGATTQETEPESDVQPPGRPLSYDTSELRDVADRALHLEAALARLEEGSSAPR